MCGNSSCACQRLDVIAVADMSVWKRDVLKTPLYTALTPDLTKRAMSMATIDIMSICYDDYGTSPVVWICGLIKVE